MDLKIELMDINLLTPTPNNVKEHPEEQIEQICESIREFGFNDPIAIDENNVIIEGNGRAESAKKMGINVVPVIRLAHMPEEKKRAYILAHNKLTMNTGFNLEKLKIELKDIQLKGIEPIKLGFSKIELKNLFREKKKENDEEVDDLVNKASKGELETIAQVGDIWALGPHRLLCGDCTDPEQIKRLMDGKLADLMVTDPPYNVAYEGKTKDALKIENDSMGDADFRQFLFKFYKNTLDHTKPGGAIYVFHADSEGYNFRGAMIDAGWDMKQCLIWLKNHMVMGRQDYHWKHEPVLYGWKPGASHTWNTDRRQTTILSFDRPSRNPDHPTPKPLDMLEYLIKNSSRDEELVIDPFLGSGSTLIAAHQTGRVCYGSELSPIYATVIIKRFEKLTGLKAEKVI